MSDDNKDSPLSQDARDRASEINPVGAARRRLMRAILASGGAVAGGLFVARWHKPIIDTVVTPAHARTSAVGCAVTLSFSLESLANTTTTYDYSMSVYVRSGAGGPSTLLGVANTVGPASTGVHFPCPGDVSWWIFLFCSDESFRSHTGLWRDMLHRVMEYAGLWC